MSKRILVVEDQPDNRQIIREIQSSGVTSHRGIARSLNSRGLATARWRMDSSASRLNLAGILRAVDPSNNKQTNKQS
jgi:CheY-like chemotaxis protein